MIKKLTVGKILAAVFLWEVCIGTAYAVDPVSSFEQIIFHGKSAVDQSTLVIFNEKKSTWLKRRYTVSGMKYDVKKTDSLVSPVIAQVKFYLIDDYALPFQSKEEAEAASDYDPKLENTNEVTLNYAFTSNKWIFNGGNWVSIWAKKFNETNNKYPITSTFQINPDNLTPEKETVHWAVIRFLP